MAGKSRRVAARQSQLNRHRKKQQRGPSGIPTAVPEPANLATEADGRPDARSEAVSAATATATAEPTWRQGARSTAPASSGQASNPGRSPARLREESPPAYQYMGPEIRRIIAMAGTGFAVLVALKFIL